MPFKVIQGRPASLSFCDS